MSTSIEGVYFNKNLPISGATVTAQSIDGYSEGSDTTDSNGHFKITGLADKDWFAKATSDPVDGTFYLIPNPVFHRDLSTISADQHHAGFIGFLDSSSRLVDPDSNDRIQVTDDGVINADQGGEEGGILALTIDQAQIDHGSVGGITDDDHARYADVGGRSAGQSIAGGTATGENLTLLGNSALLDGSVLIGDSTRFDFDVSAGQMKLPGGPNGGNAAGIVFGGDANLYQNSANELKTDDSLTVTGVLKCPDRVNLTGSGSARGILIGSDALLYRVSADVFRTPDSLIIDTDLTVSGIANLNGTLATLTTRGDLLRAGAAAALERLSAVTAGALVGGDGTDVVATVRKCTVDFSAAGGAPTTTGGCSDGTKVEAAANDDYWVLDFDKDTDEFAFWPSFIMPGNYNGGTFTVEMIEWTTESGASAETVRFAVSIKVVANDDADSIAYGTAVNIDDTWIANGDVHTTGASSAITPGGNGGAGDPCHVRIMRDISGDDLGGDARFRSMRLSYTTNAISDVP